MKQKWHLRGIFTLGAMLAMHQTGLSYDPKTLDLLKQNIAEWNAMRLATQGRTIDLSGAPLEHTDLSAACLVKANLKGAFMKGARLVNADLQEANLRWSVFEEADLRGANMVNAKLFEANFEGANLKGASLKGATLMEQANFSGATLSNNTILPDSKRADARWCLLHNARFVPEPENTASAVTSPCTELLTLSSRPFSFTSSIEERGERGKRVLQQVPSEVNFEKASLENANMEGANHKAL